MCGGSWPVTDRRREPTREGYEGAAKPRPRIALVAGSGSRCSAACGGGGGSRLALPDEAAHGGRHRNPRGGHRLRPRRWRPGSGGAATCSAARATLRCRRVRARADTHAHADAHHHAAAPLGHRRRPGPGDGPRLAEQGQERHPDAVLRRLPHLSAKITSKSCLYGHTSSHTTIAMKLSYGDSHALAWFPAVLKAVNDRGWRLLNVTMAGCTPADITPADGYGKVLPACIAFRKAALAKLAKYHPTVILVTGTRGFATVDRPGHLLTGPTRTAVWIAGMKRTIAKLIPLARRVALISDTPISKFSNPPSCLSAHLSHTIACATPVSYAIGYGWINNELSVALAKHVAFLDAERWVCPTSPCPLVRGTLVVHRDHGHMTAKFASSLWKKMEGALDQIIATPGVVIGP
ncbi:MAG: SGNH hydrolase domain-containing protein [Chloroflexota bacterium]